MTLTDTTDYAECGGISIALALLPTLGLLISELLPYIHKSDKCNGLLQTAVCAIQHIIRREPCSMADVQQAVQNISAIDVSKMEEGEEEEMRNDI